jgi:nucleotide-binding universal stress UspA family protein
MQRILVAVDGSAPSLKAVEYAADLASKYDAELILAAVGPHPTPTVDPDLAAYARLEHIAAPSAEFATAAIEGVLDQARVAAQQAGAKRISAEPSFGDPGELILAAAKDRAADLIVVGSRGHGRLVGLLLGSVAQKLAGLAACPVLVVR